MWLLDTFFFFGGERRKVSMGTRHHVTASLVTMRDVTETPVGVWGVLERLLWLRLVLFEQTFFFFLPFLVEIFVIYTTYSLNQQLKATRYNKVKRQCLKKNQLVAVMFHLYWPCFTCTPLISRFALKISRTPNPPQPTCDAHNSLKTLKSKLLPLVLN